VALVDFTIKKEKVSCFEKNLILNKSKTGKSQKASDAGLYCNL
jgi:hypothetical protein